MTRANKREDRGSMPKPPRRVYPVDFLVRSEDFSDDGQVVPEAGLAEQWCDLFRTLLVELVRDSDAVTAGLSVLPLGRSVTLRVSLIEHVGVAGQGVTVGVVCHLSAVGRNQTVEVTRSLEGFYIPHTYALFEEPRPGPTPTLDRVTELSGGKPHEPAVATPAKPKPTPKAKAKPQPVGGVKPKRAPQPSAHGKDPKPKSNRRKVSVPIEAITPAAEPTPLIDEIERIGNAAAESVVVLKKGGA